MKDIIAWAIANNVSESIIPREESQLADLTELFLINTQLTTLPESIGQLKNLKKLSILFNRLTTLEGLEKLTKLKELYVRNNRAVMTKRLPGCIIFC